MLDILSARRFSKWEETLFAQFDEAVVLAVLIDDDLLIKDKNSSGVCQPQDSARTFASGYATYQAARWGVPNWNGPIIEWHIDSVPSDGVWIGEFHVLGKYQMRANNVFFDVVDSDAFTVCHGQKLFVVSNVEVSTHGCSDDSFA